MTRASDLKCTTCGQHTNKQQRRNVYAYNIKYNHHTLRKYNLDINSKTQHREKERQRERKKDKKERKKERKNDITK